MTNNYSHNVSSNEPAGTARRFFDKSQSVNVSRITREGWWIENTVEHVSKGTALGRDFTQNIYTPSSEGMIARYDSENDVWSDEILDMTWKKYWGVNGEPFIIGSPDGEYPEWAIMEEPPEYDKKTQTVLYTKEKQWKVFEILVGKRFYDELAFEFIVSDYNFELPDGCTWDAPPFVDEGFAPKLVDGEWQILEDHRGKIAYKKDRSSLDYGDDYEVEELGLIPETHTLVEPLPCSVWNGDAWVKQLELVQLAKRKEINDWRNDQETDENQTVQAHGRLWDSAPAARARIESTLNSNYHPPFWTDANDNDVPVTPEILKDVHTAIVARGFEIHARQRAMKDELLKLRSIKLVEDYRIGWPE